MGQRKVNMAKIRHVFTSIPFNNHRIDKQVEIDAHYYGYLSKQKRDIEAFKKG